jgi:hypothetical protein
MMSRDTAGGGSGSGEDSNTLPLLADSESFNDRAIPIGILGLQVIKKPAALTNHLEQPSAGMMIFRMDFEMLRQITNSFAQNGNLNLGRARIRIMCAVRVHDLALLLSVECHCNPPLGSKVVTITHSQTHVNCSLAVGVNEKCESNLFGLPSGDRFREIRGGFAGHEFPKLASN